MKTLTIHDPKNKKRVGDASVLLSFLVFVLSYMELDDSSMKVIKIVSSPRKINYKINLEEPHCDCLNVFLFFLCGKDLTPM